MSGGDLNVGFSLLATSKLFWKGKERGSSLCAWDKRNPRGLVKMSHPQRKHMELTKGQVSRSLEGRKCFNSNKI